MAPLAACAFFHKPLACCGFGPDGEVEMVESGRKGSPKEAEPATVQLARYSGMGLQVAGSVGLFMAAGWWADGKLGITPVLTIVGALGGGFVAFFNLYQHLVKRGGGKPPES
jgi:hypothetical protein